MLVGHEGQHVFDQAPTGGMGLDSEVRAETVSQDIVQGIGGLRSGDTFQIRGMTLFAPATMMSPMPGASFFRTAAAMQVGLTDYEYDLANDNANQ